MHDVWSSSGLVHYICIYIFGGSRPLTEFCPAQNLLYVQVLCSPILSALLRGTRAAGISQILWRGTRNGITELSQRAPPVFGWVTITLGIGHILVMTAVRPYLTCIGPKLHSVVLDFHIVSTVMAWSSRYRWLVDANGHL